MAIVSTSCNIRDQSPTHAKQMLQLTDRIFNDSSFSLSCLADFDQDPESSSTLSVLVEDFQQQVSETENASDLQKKRYQESIALSSGTSAVSRVVPYPISQQLSIGHESIWHGSSGDFGSLGINEADLWEDVRLCSQEMPTAALLPPQIHGWIEGSTSCTTSGDIMSNTVSVEFERPLLQRSYTIPTYAVHASPGEGNNLECPPPLQHEQSSHSPQPVATSTTSAFSDPSLIYQGSSRSRTNESDGEILLSSSSQPNSLERTLFPPLQPSTSRKSRFHSQTLGRDRVQDSAIVEDFRDTVDVSMPLGARQHNVMQQELRLSMSRSPDLHGGRQPGQCGTELHFTTDNLNDLKLKQNPLAKPAPRKCRRRRVLKGIDMEPDEVDGVPTPLGHIQRERRRRDLMTSKVAALELLLPKSTTGKRDRVAVVEDTIQLLKKLERDLKDLQQRFHEAKLRRAVYKQSREPKRLSIPKSIIKCNMETVGSYFSNGIVIKRMGTYMKAVAIRTQPTRATSRRSRPTHLSSGTECSGGSNVVDKGNVFVEFHVHLDDTGTVQEKILKCRCRMDYLRTMIGVVDEFQLDLTTCNILKLSGYFICIMRLRARTRADMMSAAHFAVRLQSVIDVDIASEAVTTSLPGATISENKQKLTCYKWNSMFSRNLKSN